MAVTGRHWKNLYFMKKVEVTQSYLRWQALCKDSPQSQDKSDFAAVVKRQSLRSAEVLVIIPEK